MKRRKALQQQQNEDVNKVLAEIREKDRERILYFRQLGEIAERYAWKGIHQGEVRRKLREQNRPTGRRPPLPAVIQHSLVPFPDVWMNAVFHVTPSIYIYCTVSGSF